MKERGHRIIRYADDILILCQSKSAAYNALEQASRYLEGEFLLNVNSEKTHVCHSWKGGGFLGVSIHSSYTRIQKAKIKRFKAKVKAMTRRNRPNLIDDLNPIFAGFAMYYRIANCKIVLSGLARWVRRCIRAILMKLCKETQSASSQATPARVQRRV